MRAAIRLLRSLLFSRALALSLVPLGTLTPSPAPAYWYLGFYTGNSPYQVCLSAAPPFILVDMRPEYHPTNGSYIGELCSFFYPLNGQTSHATVRTSCNAGEVKNIWALIGCTLFGPPHTNNNGNQCPKPSVGNPVSPLVGNKYEEALDLATAGPDLLELRRYYNSFAPASLCSGGIGAPISTAVSSNPGRASRR